VPLGALHAATATTGVHIDPAIERALATGLAGPTNRRVQAPLAHEAQVVLTLREAPSAEVLDAVERAGVRLDRVGGVVAIVGRVVSARIDARALARLSSLAAVERVSLAPTTFLPLDSSGAQLSLEGAWGARRDAEDGVTGKGIVVADLDSNADVFHPHFFRGDGGYFDWIDVDGDGVFTPGKDGIDLDRDGALGGREAALVLRAETMDTFRAEVLPARAPGFDPAIDWLYLDENQNGQRDFGKAAGFDDSTPAFGEPLFVPDDVNRNGKLDVGERVVRLGTSKFRKVYVHLDYPRRVDVEYVRGRNLTEHKNNFTSGVYGFSDALHGTATLSVVAGDVPLVGRRWVGVAPDAELLLSFELNTSAAASTRGLAWAVREKADVFLHEMTQWVSVPLDGSDPFSAIVDETTRTARAVHTCPAGNQGGSRKHARLVVPKGAQRSLPLDVPRDVQGSPVTSVYVTVHARGGRRLSFTVRPPGEAPFVVTAEDETVTGAFGAGARYYVTVETTSRGTQVVSAVFYTETADQPVPSGAWAFDVSGDPDEAATIDGYVSDNVSGFALGAGWVAPFASDDRTIGWPATADLCITVGAHTNHAATPETPWFRYPGAPLTVRDYSSRGPRIDGVQKPDVTAPDNPWAALPNDAVYAYGPGKHLHGAFGPYGGTSGAAPHVTGTAALLAQVGVRGEAAREAIRAGATVDAITGEVPNADYGFGRVNAARALGGVEAASLPTIVLVPRAKAARPGEGVVIDVDARDPAGGPVEVRWDDGYDGTWDTPYAPPASFTLTRGEPGRAAVKARVRTASGRVAEAIATVAFGAVAGAADEAAPNDTGCGCREAPGSAGARGAAAVSAFAVLALAAARRRRGRHA
jgi:hypothetical protein